MTISLSDDGNATGEIDVFELTEDKHAKCTLSLSDIHGAWYLREGPIQPLPSIEELEERFRINEARAATKSIFSMLACPWVNRREDIDYVTSNKLYQQLIAQRCGLKTPRTLISSNHASAATFSRSVKKVLLKSIGYTHLDTDGNLHLYSQLVPHREIVASKLSVESCPIFMQEYIEKKYEYRVMVIGSSVLACRIDSQSSERTKIDWRHYDFDKVEHVQSELPVHVSDKLFGFMKEIGLRYGAIDLIETPAGEFVFLEVNPSGQWGWIADIAKLPIPLAVAEMLRSL